MSDIEPGALVGTSEMAEQLYTELERCNTLVALVRESLEKSLSGLDEARFLEKTGLTREEFLADVMESIWGLTGDLLDLGVEVEVKFRVRDPSR